MTYFDVHDLDDLLGWQWEFPASIHGTPIDHAGRRGPYTRSLAPDRTLTRADWTWRDRAACNGKPLDWFHFELANGCKSGEKNRAMAARGKAVCNSCPVRAECLDYAERNDERYGIWGGLTVRERDERRKARRRGRVA